MENLTPGQIFTIAIGIILAVAGAVNTVGSAIEKLAKVKQAAKAPNVAQDAEIAELKVRMEKVERKLENDKQELDAIREYNRISALAQIALLDHGLDGNNVKPMQDAKDELHHWLARK